MNLFDIVGPVMVGPSSSHTAGAVRIGQVSRHLLGESVKEAKILLHRIISCNRKRTWYRQSISGRITWHGSR